MQPLRFLLQQFLLPLSRGIDLCTEITGKFVGWLILATVLVSSINATVRKAFDIGSNAFLELQWYLFAAVFLMAAGYTLMRNEHVRIDVFTSRLSPQGRAWIDIIGLVFFLFPVCGLMTVLGWDQFVLAYVGNEMSSNAGGLIRWPAKLLIPVGFALLIVQGLSELIKRIAFLQGLIPDPTAKVATRTAEEELADAIRANAAAEGQAAPLQPTTSTPR